jgi:hypothetical protein
MATTGFTIDAVSVEGPGKANSTLSFRPGLNVVAGASNTGKTYVFQILDYMLGGSGAPKSIPQALGYAEAYLQITRRSGGTVTMRRSLHGGDAALYEGPLNDLEERQTVTTLGSKHERGNIDTISGYLLSLSGLLDREVRTNAQGEKRSLSFRDLAWLTLIDEERIIAERSPALSGQYTEDTAERSVLGLFLTGIDDAAIVATEKPKDRRTRLQAELAILGQLLSEREARLAATGLDPVDLEEDRKRVRAAIEEASQLIAAAQDELNEAAAERDQSWSNLQTSAAQRRFLAEQIKRIRLLREHYKSDSQRLASALEAGLAFDQLPAGECPVCGALPTESDDVTATRLAEFQSGCAAEIAKISALLSDLDATERTLGDEDRSLAETEQALTTSVNSASAAISQLLARKRQVANNDLMQLMARENQLTEAILLAAEISDLKCREESVQAELAKKQKRTKIEPKVETSTAARFCQVLEETLKAWRFPFEGTVSFDSTRFDVVIGDQNRGSFGKGYRAVTHAAFTVALMRYCRQEGFPHPGVVILDTPLNPFKGPDKDSAERINQEVQEAFYADLAADTSGDQFIVFENTEPSDALKERISYQHFSGNAAAGRAGFYPALE